MVEALSQIPGKGSGHGAHLRAGSPPADAQGSVRFAHRTLSLHGLCPRCWFGTRRNSATPVKKLWSLCVSCGNERKSREKTQSLHRVEFSLAPENKTKTAETPSSPRVCCFRVPRRLLRLGGLFLSAMIRVHPRRKKSNPSPRP